MRVVVFLFANICATGSDPNQPAASSDLLPPVSLATRFKSNAVFMGLFVYLDQMTKSTSLAQSPITPAVAVLQAARYCVLLTLADRMDYHLFSHVNYPTRQSALATIIRSLIVLTTDVISQHSSSSLQMVAGVAGSVLLGELLVAQLQKWKSDARLAALGRPSTSDWGEVETQVCDQIDKEGKME